MRANATRTDRFRSWIPTAAVLVALFMAPAALAGGERWFHVRVEPFDGSGERVAINIPLSFVRSMLPMIETDEFRGGSIYIDEEDLNGIDLREVLQALRDAPDADFVTVRSETEDVVVRKENGFLLVRANDGDDRVRVRLPLAIVEAMIDPSQPNRLDLAGALDALAAYDGGDLVTVESRDSNVRIWIDSDQTGGER